MSYGVASDEVAKDYLQALQDLQLNSRYEISNLTVIAKENTEHALAISEALKNHIKQTSPQKKLPAFYVLDSVVKNVGTPYTLFFGRQLYATFMEAYALVDNSVRNKMVEMLKTWKEPVPGSMDTRPVFPPEVTRPIENALIKAKTSYVQMTQDRMRIQQQSMGRGRPTPSSTPYRETPTPPNAYQQPPPGYPPQSHPSQQYPPPMNGQQYPPPANGQQYVSLANGQQYPPLANGQQYAPQPSIQAPQYSTQPVRAQQFNGQYGLPPRPPPSQQYSSAPVNTSYWQSASQPPPSPYQEPDNGLGTLSNDIERCITTAKADWARNPADPTIGTRLKALLDLQSLLQNQQLPPDQIALVKLQVAQLSNAAQAVPIIQTPPAPLPPKPVVVAQPLAQAPTQQPSLNSLLGPGALAALSNLARQSATPQPQAQAATPIPAPQIHQIHPHHPYQPPPGTAPAPMTNPMALLEQLRARGILGGPASTPTSLNTTSRNLPGFPPPLSLGTPPSSSRTPLAQIPNDVVLKAASLKIPRPHLISKLYEQQGIPCTQCGRRFQSDAEGKKVKAAHMDWHFHVRQRMDEAESRGQHRSWYVDELDWIKSREVEGESGAITTEFASGPGSSADVSNPKLQYLAVPDDPALKNSLCPICQEKFEMKWLDEAQEFVWMDAKKAGDRIYHASCHLEATKDVNTQIKRGTPEPVLGKRKAEDDHMVMRTKIKSEPVS